jgi:hypothetical protein
MLTCPGCLPAFAGSGEETREGPSGPGLVLLHRQFVGTGLCHPAFRLFTGGSGDFLGKVEFGLLEIELPLAQATSGVDL